MENRKLTVASTGPRIQEFVNGLIRDAGFELRCEVGEAASIHPDFENPDIVVRFLRPGRRSTAGEQSGAAAGNGASDDGNAPYVRRRPRAASVRRE